MKNTWKVLPFVVVLTACLGDSDPGTGTLRLAMTDAPVDGVKHVYVQFSGVELQGPDGRVTKTFAAPKQIDLLKLTGVNSEALGDFDVTAGQYQWMRLMVDTDGDRDSYLVDASGAEHELDIPSGGQTGLKLNRGFTVGAGGVTDFTIDFDLRKSVVLANDEYKLRPTLRVVDNLQVGHLTGTLATGTCSSGLDKAGVYVFAGSDATPDDIWRTPSGESQGPLVTASVATDGKYTVGFLEAGNYTVTHTCDLAADDPELDQELTFGTPKNVTVVANLPTAVDF